MKLQLRDLHLDGPITRPYDVELNYEDVWFDRTLL